MEKRIFPNLAMFEEAEAYWSAQLSGELQEVRLPGDFRGSREYVEGRTGRLAFPAELGEKMLLISKNNNLSLFIILLTAFKILLFKLTGQDDIIVASPIYTPTNQEYNKYVLFRDRLSSPMGFKDFLMHVKQTVVEGYKNEHYPIQNLVKSLDIAGGGSLLRVALLLEDIHQVDFIRQAIDQQANDVILAVGKNGETLDGHILYNAKLFREESMLRIFDFYLLTLTQVLSRTELEIGRVELYSPAEKRQILFDFNNTKTEYPGPQTIHERFEAQVLKTPAHTAVSSVLDVSDIYDELASAGTNSRLFEKFKKCCFKKNPYVHESKLTVAGAGGDLRLVKTHRHNNLVVNGSLLRLLEQFDGEKNTAAIFEQWKNTPLKLLLQAVPSVDILEVEYDWGDTLKISVEGRFSYFVEVIKALYKNNLVDLDGFKDTVVNTGRSGGEAAGSIGWQDVTLSPADIWAPRRDLAGCRVLILGDTPGTPTTGILYLASYLRRNGITACCQFYDVSRSPAALKHNLERLLAEMQPGIVAVSLKWSLYMGRVREICKIVKQYSADIKTVVGGNTASYYYERIIQYEYIDCVIRGDGEAPLLALCRDADYVPNAVYKRGGKIVTNPLTYVEDEALSRQIYLSHLDEILVSNISSRLGTFFIYTHKGCSLNCFYCGGCRQAQERIFNRPKLLNRPADLVRRDILAAREYASTFMFDFVETNERLLAYLKKIWQGIDLTAHFCIYVNVSPPSAEIIALASRTFKYVYWDIDMTSLSQGHRYRLAELKLVKPQPGDDELFAFFDECEKYDNAEVRLNLINGLPFLSTEDIAAAEKVLSQIMATYSTLSGLHWGRLHAQPGAPILDKVEAYGMFAAARSYEDFLECSEKNFNQPAPHPGVETFDYPYIYFDDDELNSRVSQSYLNMNARLHEYIEGKRRKIFCEDWTYRELNDRANRLAALLRGKGVTAGSIVALMVDSSLDMAAGILAILKAGGAYFPIDPGLPAERIDFMLKEGGASLLLTRSAVLDKQSMPDYARPGGTRELCRTAGRPQVQDLDRLPIPDRSLYEKHNLYFDREIVKNSIALQATRGCPFKCAYCHKIWPKTHVVRSAESLLEEVRLFYNMGIRRFTFLDDIFNLNIKNSRRFFELIGRNGLDVRLYFPNGMRGDILTGDYIDAMVEAGTAELALALETASPRLQKLVMKHLNLKKLHRNLEYLCEKHPHVVSILFMMHGFPSETAEEARLTVDFIKDLRWLHFPLFSKLKIYPHTDMERLALENGISREAILKSENLGFHETPATIPFDRKVTLECQTDFLDNYFLVKERLLHVLPWQMKAMTEEELLKKYSNHLPVEFKSFTQLRQFLGILEDELAGSQCLPREDIAVPHLDEGMRQYFPARQAGAGALRILLLDLSQVFSGDRLFFDVYEPPTGLIHLMTYVYERFGQKVRGKLAKARYDFDSYEELAALLEAFKPDVVGVRTLTFFKDFFHRTVARIREWGFSGPLVAGGPYATTNFDGVLQDRHIDLLVMGEGEVTFCELLQAIMDNGGKLPPQEELMKIPGIAFMREAAAAEAALPLDCIWLDEFYRHPRQALGPGPGNPVHASRPHDLAYMIFTSGTTGKPRAVLVEHGGLVNYVDWRLEAYGCGAADVTLQPLSYSFDGFGANFYSSLLSGGRLILVPDARKLDFAFVKEIIRAEKVTNSSLVPGMYEALLQSAAGKDLESLRFVVLAGERSGGALIRKSKEMAPRLRLHNEYGPTEATVTAAALRDIDGANTALMGRPIANTRVYVLDSHLQPLPINIPGELCIAGKGVAEGYLNNPEQTVERFRLNPSVPGERVYRSGDLGRFLPDGRLELYGRLDHQVKIRGFRLEPEEIKNQLLAIEPITEALVVARGDETGGDEGPEERYLCAYFTAPKEMPVPGLKERLSARLPDYMIPAFFVQLAAFPLTVNGKIDRRALPAPGAVTAERIAAPSDAVEEKLLAVWADVLGLDRDKIGIDASFFDLGGHSLKAINLISRIHREFNVRVPVGEMFKTPTIGGLAGYIRGIADSCQFVPIKPAPVKEYYPLSSAQKRIYIMQQMAPQSTFYNVFQVNHLPADIDRGRLDTIFKTLIHRHESLRTSFEMRNGEPVQEIHEEVDFAVAYFEAADLERPGLEAISRDFVKPFDLTRLPLFRVGLITTAKDNILMIDMHHIISDGTSHKILSEEFQALYEGRDLPRLGLQYKDYAEWQRGEEQRNLTGQQEKYWLDRFSAGIPSLDLPTDFTRPANRSFDGYSVSFVLSRPETRFIKDMSRDTEFTLFMVLLAVYNILLYKLSGEEDIVVGTSTAARTHADLQRLIGMFVNTLALRNRVGADETFGSLLKEVKENTLRAFENQEYQFEDLVEQLGVDRDAGRNPIFDVMFNLQNQAEYDGDYFLNLDTGSGEYVHREGSSKFDLTLTAVDLGEHIHLDFEYCKGLFKPPTVERFIGYLRGIISGLSGNTGQEISEIDMIPRAEREQLLVDFNNTAADFPGDKTLHRLFAEQADKTPHRTALILEDQRLTYRLLDERAAQMARVLRGKGVFANTIVGLMLERSLAMLTAIIGIWKAGGAYLPIDPEYPQERQGYMLADSSAGVLVTAAHLFAPGERLTHCLPRQGVVLAEDQAGFAGSGDMERLPDHTTAGDLAYVLYTSGTTGTPKGVMVEHRGVLNLHAAFKDRFDITPDDTIVLFASISFDASLSEIVMTLLNGAALCLLTERLIGDFDQFKKYMTAHDVTIATIPPPYLNHFGPADLKSLRVLISAGSPPTPTLIDTWREEVEFFNAYGLTETTVCAANVNMSRGNFNGQAATVGFPIYNTRAYVLDAHGRVQAAGVRGELCIAGVGLARGYANSLDLTAERFVSLPFAGNGRLFKTGDMARRLADGNIEFLGRRDHQVKIRGFRIEPAEIENRLLRHRDIVEAVVIDRWADGERYLCGYYAAAARMETPALRHFLSQSLPDYMIPAYFVRLDQIPLTPNGKVDRRALPEPRLEAADDYIGPGDGIERRLAAIWSDILNVDERLIGIQANFFELGGHSLKATVLVSRIHQEMNIKIPLAEVFRLLSIRGLAEYIRAALEDKYLAIRPVEKREYYEASNAQQRMWTVCQSEESSISFNLTSVFTFNDIDRCALEGTFHKLIERHESLRTVFLPLAEEVKQKVLLPAEIDFKVEYTDLRAAADREEQMEEFRKLDKNTPFDLLRGPLMRARLLHLEAQKWVLLFTIHHIACDILSVELLIKEFGAVYEGQLLPELRIQYRDYVYWQDEQLRGENIEILENYWLDKFKDGVPLLELPYDKERQPIQTYNGNSASFVIPAGITGKLRAIAHESEATLFMVLLTSFKVLLFHFSGQNDLVVGTVFGGRVHPDAENQIGNYLNTLALRSTFAEDASFLNILRIVKTGTLEAIKYQLYPIDMIVDRLKVKRDVSRQPLFDVALGMINLSHPETGLFRENNETRAIRIRQQIRSKYDLSVYFIENTDSIDVIFEYNSDLFFNKTIVAMIKHYLKLFEGIAGDPRLSVSALILKEKIEEPSFHSFAREAVG